MDNESIAPAGDTRERVPGWALNEVAPLTSDQLAPVVGTAVAHIETADPAGWGAAHEENVSDGDAGTPGIQYTDAGAAADSLTYYYLITAENVCGETALR